ncbi:MAG: cytochrome c [Gammaproteobacteria bacterium]|nr:cytochrome c [Gammaproteobacteria bacterium]
MKRLVIISSLLGLVWTYSMAVAGGDVEAGKAKAQVCVSCHGTDGIGTQPQFPNLAGQHHDYMVRALQDYKSGARNNAIMKGFVANLSKADMQDLAAYYSTREAVLFTPKVE